MKQTALTHEDFNKFLWAVPRLEPFHSTTGKPPMSSDDFIILYKLLFYCALKINEVLRLKKGNFDLVNNVLKINTRVEGQDITTIPPIIWGDIKKFLKNKVDDEFLFISKRYRKPINRQTPWQYAKDAGNLAGLNVFQITEAREIEGVSLLLFRNSYKQFLLNKGAALGLVELKLRSETDNRYGGSTLHDLKSFEAKIFKRKLNEDEIQEYVNWYLENRTLYHDLSLEVQKITSVILKKRGIKVREVKPREKEFESFKRKLQDGVTFDPKKMQDLAGIRIICFVKSDVKSVREAIENTFDVIDKKEADRKNDFSGYSDVQYVCKLKKARISSSEDLNQFENRYFEIQIRTILQDAWSEIEHDDIYKNTEEIPEALRRRFFLVSNTLEMADNELDNLHHSIKQKK